MAKVEEKKGTLRKEELKDTLRLSSLPAMTLDVSDGDVHLQLLGGGTMRIDADVTGGRALRFSGEGTTLMAARSLGRHYYGSDISPTWH